MLFRSFFQTVLVRINPCFVHHALHELAIRDRTGHLSACVQHDRHRGGGFARAHANAGANFGVLRKVSVVYRQTVIGFSKCNKYSPPEVVSKSPRHACSNAPPAKSSPTAEMRNGWGAPGGAMWTTPSAMLRPTPPGVCRTRPGQVVPRVSEWPGNGDARTSITMPPTTTTAPDTEDGDVVSTRCATRRRAAAARIFWLTLTKTCGVLWGVPRSASC